jgi:hypothetical protein
LLYFVGTSRSKSISVGSTLVRRISMPEQHNKPSVDVEFVRCGLMGRNISGRNILLDGRRATLIFIPRTTTG